MTENFDEQDFIKFETCKYRSTSTIVKKACCSSKKIEGYFCSLKKIYPLSPLSHCLNCNFFTPDF